MKPVALVLLLCLAVACQGRVLLPKEPLDIPVAIVSESEPQALPLTKSEADSEPTLKQEEAKPAAARLEETKEPEKAQPELKEAAQPELKETAQPELTEAAKTELKEAKQEAINAEPADNKPLNQEESKPELKKEAREEAEIKADPKPEQQPEQLQEQPAAIKAELKPELPAAQPEAQPAAQAEAQPEAPSSPILKALASEEVVAAPEPVDAAVVDASADAVQPHVRQATQATPTQSSTQQNFVQQLIQNSPIGQFLSQFNGQPQQQQQQQAAAAQQDAAEQPATPAPTIPGFLNPSAAITSAQNAVQNAAQSVVNTTTQAFQGIQQFANNLGTQFQNTLSGLTGQQQQQNAQPTTARPPGPIQSFVSNVFGGGNNATAASPPQQQGPLQGIINFLGGNRPTSAPAAAAAAPAPAQTTAQETGVDDKLEAASEIAEQSQTGAVNENEVRTSAEAIDDSFEEAVPSNEVITVNDDASAAAAADNNAVDGEQEATFVDSAVAL
ncbi:hypothetical protein KR093_001586 [Drosophila rubida]|uniref:20-hydroxyecdysone protein n=1 Tax=Drosophila rubida TaxID=30044 RepID=A0AAD4JVG8_9MUSC|nr:hypothetical protein KR093_001586 [Drosophila rubida]